VRGVIACIHYLFSSSFFLFVHLSLLSLWSLIMVIAIGRFSFCLCLLACACFFLLYCDER
jgi:hypothetical protein